MPSKRPTPPQPKDLDEVERALSVLDGRHPEHEKSRRETAEAARKRNVALAAELAVSARRRRRRIVVVCANIVAVAAVGFVAWRLTERAQALRAALGEVEGPWKALGFVEVGSNTMTASRSLDLDLPGSSCFVAVTKAAGPMTLRRGEASTRRPDAIAWCACEPGHVSVEAASTPEPAALSVMRVDARVLGGPLARPLLPPSPAWTAGGDECAEATLDAWIADHRAPAVAPDTAWLSAPGRAALVHDGFRAVPGLAAGSPFGVVEGQGATCFLAVSPAGEPLSLRTAGGARRVHAAAGGAIAWCTSAAVTTSVWREGRAAVAVVAALADRLGGLLGLREAADEARVTLAADAGWIDDSDLAWNSGAILRSGGLPGAVARALPEVAGAPDTRLAALTLGPSATAVSDPPSVVACDPPLAGAGVRSSVCATSADVAWWRKGDGAAGVATAALPVWLAPLEPHHEPDAVARIPELVGLARRLARAGFSPTVLEGVTELPDGVRIIGRAGEDAVVAVGVGQRAPWTFPYTNGVPWDLGDVPAIVPVQPGETIKLTASPLPNTPPDKRRTIVFRRAAEP